MVQICFEFTGDDSKRDAWLMNLLGFDVSGLERGLPNGYKIREEKLIAVKHDFFTEDMIVLTPKDARNVQGSVNLKDFVHPENATYYFGGDDGSLDAEACKNAKAYVYIDTDVHLWSAQAGSIVLYDRQIKNG